MPKESYTLRVKLLGKLVDVRDDTFRGLSDLNTRARSGFRAHFGPGLRRI